MDEDRIKRYAERLKEGENRKIDCPDCMEAGKGKGDLSMSVINKGDHAIYNCHREPLHSGRVNYRERVAEPESPVVKENPTVEQATSGQLWLENERKISFERAAPFISFGSAYFKAANKSLPCIEFVYKNKLGRKVYSKFRAIEQKLFTSGVSMPGGTDTLYLTEAIDEARNYLVITEGELDALALKACGFNAAGMPTGANIKWLLHNANMLSKFKHVLIWFDTDSKGDTVAEKLRAAPPALTQNFTYIVGAKLEAIAPGCKDANDILKKFGPPELKKALSECFEKYRPEYIIKPSSLLPSLIRVRDNTYANRIGIDEPRLDEVMSLVPGYAGIVTGIPGHGKALALDTPVPTPSGWTTMGEISVGEIVYAEDGSPCKVTRVSEIHLDRPCYKIVFDDGATVVADAEHQWVTSSEKSTRSALSASKRHGGPLKTRGKCQKHLRTFPSVVTTKEISETLVSQGKTNHQIYLCGALKGETLTLPVEPYTLGAWLGDGDSASGGFTCFDAGILDRIRQDGYSISNHKKSGRYTIRGLAANLRSLGLLKNKHIPAAYQRASVDQRVALLMGLMDTDGHCAKDATCEFTTTSKRLADEFLELALGLGLKATVCVGDATIYGRVISKKYRIRFTTNAKVFSLKRKLERQLLKKSTRASSRRIVACERVPSVPVRCIEVDSPSHLFLVTRSCIPTHNSTFLTWYAYRLADKYGLKTVFWSPENDPALLTSDLIGMAAGRLVQGHAGVSAMSNLEIENGMKFLDEHFRVVQDGEEGSDIDEILNQMHASALDMGGAKLYIIDPLNYVKMPEAKDKLIAEKIVYSKIRRFARNHNCCLVVVAHPRKMEEIDQRKAKKEDDDASESPVENGGMKKYKVPGMYSVSGSADFANMADLGITVYRDDRCTTITNWKARRQFLGTIGASADVVYQPSSGRFRVLGTQGAGRGYDYAPDAAPF